MRTDDQRDFEKLLTDSLPELPPEDIAHDVSPWRTHMQNVLCGLALTLVTFNLSWLTYMLILCGALRLFLGLRALRKTDRAFAVGTIAALSNLVAKGAIIILGSTVIRIQHLTTALTVTSIISCIIILISLAVGLGNIIPGGTKAFWLLIWYLVICLLGLMNFTGIILSLAMVAAYILILHSLWKLSGELEDNGYAIVPVAPKLSDRTVTVISIVVILVGIAAGFLFGSKYPMKWRPAESGTSKVREELLELGFPSDVLADLTDEEITDCEGAARVVVSTKDHPVNRGETKKWTNDGTTNISTIYPQNELRLTSVAVKLKESNEWRVIHHFRFVEKTKFPGTESITPWSAEYIRRDEDSISGRILCEKNGVTLTADYYFSGHRSYETDTLLWRTSDRNDFFAEFSFDGGENQRGYITFTAFAPDGAYFDSWLNYTHQRGIFNYPAESAGEHRRKSLFNDYNFVTVQDALQFSTDED